MTRTRRPQWPAPARPSCPVRRAGDPRRGRHRALLGHPPDRASPSGSGWPPPGPAASPACRCGGATTRWRATRGSATGTSACCWPTTACRWPSSTPPGGGSRARPRSTSRPSTTGSGSSASANGSCSPSPTRSGARSLNAVDVFGGTWSLDEAAAAFAGLCDRAAEHGLLVHLEFLPVVADPRPGDGLAGRPRGRPAQRRAHARRLALLPERRPTARCCAPSRARPSSASSCATRRPWPSRIRSTRRCTSGCCRATASWRLPRLLADLRATGTTAPLGVEVFSDVLSALPPEEAGRLAGRSLRAVLGDG